MESEEASESLKVMADKHAVIKSHLDELEAEFASKKEHLQIEEEKLRLKGGEICITEQHIRSRNEKLFYLREDFNLKEKRQQELLTELVETQWSITKVTEEIERFKKIHKNNMHLEEIHKSKVKSVEALSSHDDKEIEPLQKEIDYLLSLKNRLEQGDLELKRIWTGEALQTIEIHKTAMLDAFPERDIETEIVQAELDDRLEQVKEAEQRVQIEEKQNQARLRLMQKQLQDLEDTEKHLKSTVQYMEQQIDYGMN